MDEEEKAINEIKSDMIDLTMLILDFIFSVFLVMWFWNWFVVPLGVVKINFAWALGLSLLVGLVGDQINSNGKKEKYNPSRSFFIKLTVLLLGYFSSLFVGG
ncbi:hypothetical protein [Providencia alcalifaciens]|uniref:hypothetical protein n=1 Tax=Providencia alcalifaciens TaxID=126385 RepID=UPI002B053299|nr:hypothetical protein [Providencia alcalifaciens]